MENNFIKIYSDFLKKKLRSNKKLKIIFDCSNGTTGPIIKKFIIHNSKFIILNSTPNGNFPGHGPDPWAKGAMEQLKKEISRQKADLGAIFDADGDRVFFIDNLGRAVEPDVIARLLIWRLNPRKAVYDIRAGWLVRKFQNPNYKFQKFFSRVGHFYIKNLMRKIDADLGMEKSGHYYFALQNGKKRLYYDDGILAAIEIINAVSRLPYSLANFADLLPQYYRSGETNIKIENGKIKMENLLKKFENYFKLKSTDYELRTINYLDGLTMEFISLAGEWWFNLRPSNTEPLIRLNAEATNKKLLDKSVKKIYSLVRNLK